MKKTIMLIFGTRPEAIKMAPVYHVLSSVQAFNVKVCITAQHREMLDQMLALFHIKPDIDLDLMKANQNLFDLTANTLLALNRVFDDDKPDMVLVHGDTTTSFVASLACYYAKIDCAHVEAGLRTHDLYAPFPEEANRLLTARLAKLHFSPTLTAKKNLLQEGVSPDSIFVTGNTVIDALLWVKQRLVWQKEWVSLYQSASSVVKAKKPFILVTGHRRENFGERLQEICQGIARIAETYSDWHIIYPVHLNPKVKKPVHELLAAYENVHLIDPLEYAPFIYLMTQSSIVLTDSGGIQEEAPALGKPVLVMRDKTERPEAVAAGTVSLVGANADKIFHSVSALINDEVLYRRMSEAINPYGEGHAAEKIVEALKTYWGINE